MALRWSDLPGRRVGVWGLGTEGAATLARLAADGVTDPVLVDDAPAAGSRAVATGHGGLALLAGCDVVVKTPGIPRYREDVRQLESAGVEVVGGLGLWLAQAPLERVICVTGSKGKSTTTRIAGHLATGLGQRVLVGGNLGTPPWAPALDASPYDCWVIETSSYQAADVAVSPAVVAVTSLSPDHLTWHGDVDSYYRDKLRLTDLPGAHDTIANAESPGLVAEAGRLGGRLRWVDLGDDRTGWTARLSLLGRHNRVNAVVAGAALAALGIPGADDEERLAVAAEGFAGLDHRLQHAGTVGGVEFYDDSLSTNVWSTSLAVRALAGRRIALIVGGHDRGIDYADLGAELAARATETRVLTLPMNGPRIRAAIEAAVQAGTAPGLLTATDHDGMDAAVADGWSWARPDGVVLLSPAAASFGAYRDYVARADAFVAAMHSIT